MYREVIDVSSRLVALLAEAADYERRNPAILGVGKFRNRVKRECRSASRLTSDVEQCVSMSAGDSVQPADESIPFRLQGLKNNFRGLSAELCIARTAPDVVAMNQVYRLNEFATGGARILCA